MKYIFTLIILVLGFGNARGKGDLTEETGPIVEEGKRLYRSEMASWYGTDLFMDIYRNKSNVGGYFSYIDNDTPKCIFFSKADTPVVIGTISFDSTYDTRTATVALNERAFTGLETTLYTLREVAKKLVLSDTFFRKYEHATMNLIPLVSGKERKVYIIAGTSDNDVVFFGNDYLLTFDSNNHLKEKKRLHQNLIPISYGEVRDGDYSMHTHLPETGDFMTATDICTLMLYEKFTHWKHHDVVSEKYLNIWDCEENRLTVVPMSTIRKINKDHKKREAKKTVAEPEGSH